jgi:nitrite reductase (NADH) small subunit
MSATEVTLGHVQAIPPGEGRVFEIGARRLAVFRSRAGLVFATQADCPHRGGPLADGLVGGHTLICPLHSLKFDLTTGRSADGTCTLRTYPTRLSDTEQIVVELGD